MKPPRLATFRLPQSDSLSARRIALTLVGGGHVILALAERRISFEIPGIPAFDGGISGCDVVELRSGIFFVDVSAEHRTLDALTVVVGLKTGFAVIVHQQRVPGCNPAVTQTFHAATVNDVLPVGVQPGPTRGLNGRWHLLRYSPENLYEHIYLSTTRMASHNLATQNTPGRAEFHDATYWQFNDGIYLIGWRERDSEAGMLVCEDLVTLRTTGKVFHPAGPDRSGNVPVGGYILPVRVQLPENVDFDRP